MLPSSTANDANDARRRSARRNSAGGPQNTSTTSPVGPGSPSERVAARKRRTSRGREPELLVQQESNTDQPDSDDIGSHRKGLQDEAYQITPGGSKKRLQSTSSGRSLEDAADMVDQERIQRLHQQLDDHTLPQHDERSRRRSHESQNRPLSPVSTTRAGLPDFKTRLRQMLPTMKSSRHDSQRRKAASERGPRTMGLSAVDQQVTDTSRARRPEVHSAHVRSIAFDSDIFDILEDKPRNSGSAHKRRLSAAAVDSARTAGTTTNFPSSGLLKRWQNKRPSSITASSRPPSSHATTTLGLERHTTPPNTTESQSFHNYASITTPTSLDSAAADTNDQGTPGRPSLKSVLSYRLKRKSKRAELVQELSSRDSLRLRETSRTTSTAQSLNDNAQHIRESLRSTKDRSSSPPSKRNIKDDEFSTEEDAKIPATPRAISAQHNSLTSPFDDLRRTPSAQALVDNRGIPSSPVGGVATLSTIESSQSEYAEVQTGIASPKTQRSGKSRRRDHQGHSSWPSSSEHETKARKSERRSSSVPSRRDSKHEKSANRSKKKKQKSREGRVTKEPDMDLSRKSKRSSSAGALTASKEKRMSSRLSQSNSQTLRASTTHRKDPPTSESSHRHHRRKSSSLDPKSSSRRVSESRSRGTSSAIASPVKNLSTRRSLASRPKQREGSYTSLLCPPSDPMSTSALGTSRKQSSSTAKSKPSKIEEIPSSSKVRRHKVPANMKEGFEDVSERSYSIGEIAMCDDSNKGLGDSRRDQKANKKSKKKTQKKDRLSSSASARLDTSHTPSKARKGKSSRGLDSSFHHRWRSDSALMVDLFSSEQDDKHASSGQIEVSTSKSRRTTTSSIARKQDRPTTPKTKEGEVSLSVRKDHKKSPRAKKKTAKDESTGAADKPIKSGKLPGTVAILDGMESILQTTGAQSRMDKSGAVIEYLSGDGELKDQSIMQSLSDENHDSRGSLPTLDDILSVDLSTSSHVSNESSKTGSILSDEPKAGHVRSKSLPIVTGRASVGSYIEKAAAEFVSNSVDDSEHAAIVSRLKPALKSDTFSSLDAIADDPRTSFDEDELDKPSGRASLDAMRLQAADIFRDSPNGSPFSSLPHVWSAHKEVSVVERLASSMPHLGSSHGTSASESSEANSESRKPRKSPSNVGDDEIFQDDSDNSSSSPDVPDLEPIQDEKEIDVMVEIADQVEERQDPKSQSPDKSSPRPAALGLPFAMRSRERTSLVAAKGARRDFKSPRKATPDNEKGKLDRGPRIPQRRRDSFRDIRSTSLSQDIHDDNNMEEAHDQLESSLAWDTDLNQDTEASIEDVPSVRLAFSSTSMEFRRDDGNGWVQTPPDDDVAGVEIAAGMSSSAQELHSNTEMEIGWIRRSSSMGDLQGEAERWSNSLSSVNDAPPIMTRQTFPATNRSMNDRVGEELGHLFASRKLEEAKDVERTYLPVSLQSAARRYERSGKRPGPRRAGSDPPARRRGGSAVGIGRGSRPNTDSKMAVVETGLAEMFEMIGKLEEDIVRFESQTSHLPAQTPPLLPLELEGEDEDEGEESLHVEKES